MFKLVQRMGRAMRCKNKQAYFILLYFSWCEGPRADPNIFILGKINYPKKKKNELKKLKLAVNPGKKLKNADRRFKLALKL